MSDEIKYLAVVQVLGLVEDGAVVSRGFTEHLEAVRWVRDQVENAHGEVALVVPSITKLTYDFGGQPVRLTRWLYTVITSGGPTWGMIIETVETTDDIDNKINTLVAEAER